MRVLLPAQQTGAGCFLPELRARVRPTPPRKGPQHLNFPKPPHTSHRPAVSVVTRAVPPGPSPHTPAPRHRAPAAPLLFPAAAERFQGGAPRRPPPPMRAVPRRARGKLRAAPRAAGPGGGASAKARAGPASGRRRKAVVT